MVTPELLTYIKNQVAAGQNKENIKNILLANGWQEADVNTAFGELGGVMPGAPGETPAAFAKPDQSAATKQPEPTQSQAEQPGLDVSLNKPTEPAPLGGRQETVLPTETQPAPSMQAIAPDLENPVLPSAPASDRPSLAGPAALFVGKPEVAEPEFNPVTPISTLEKELSEKEANSFAAPLAEQPEVIVEPAAVKTMAELNSTRPKFSLNLKKEDLLKIGGGALVGLLLGSLIFGVGGAMLRNRTALPTPTVTSPTPGAESLTPSPELELFAYTSAEQGFKIGYPVDWTTNTEVLTLSSTTQNVFTADSGAGTTLVVALNKSTSTGLTLAGEAERLSATYESLPGFSITNQEQLTLNSSEEAYLLEVRGTLGEGVAVRSYQLVALKPDAQEYFVVALTAAESLWADQAATFRQILLSFELLVE